MDGQNHHLVGRVKVNRRRMRRRGRHGARRTCGSGYVTPPSSFIALFLPFQDEVEGPTPRNEGLSAATVTMLPRPRPHCRALARKAFTGLLLGGPCYAWFLHQEKECISQIPQERPRQKTTQTYPGRLSNGETTCTWLTASV